MTTDLQARLDAMPIFNRLQAMGILPDNALPWMLDSQDFYNALGTVLSKLDAAEAQAVEAVQAALQSAANFNELAARYETTKAQVKALAAERGAPIAGDDRDSWAAWLRDRGTFADPYIQRLRYESLASWLEHTAEEARAALKLGGE